MGEGPSQRGSGSSPATVAVVEVDVVVVDVVDLLVVNNEQK